MNLRELTGYKGNEVYKTAQNIFKKPDTGEAGYRYSELAKFTRYLEKYGFNHLGTGNFGTVYEKPGYPWVFKIFKGDRAYLYYIKYCKAHQDNENIPKIKGHTIRINNDTYAIRTEKLQPMVEADVAPIEKMTTYIRIRQHYELGPGQLQKLNELASAYPGIYEILDALSTSGYGLDIHRGNVMLRGNTIVLSDPLA